MPNKLHFYTKYSKEKIKISDKPFASGGEGAVYAIASPRSYRHLVAKIYYPEKRTEEREAKMHYLMQHPPIVFQKGQPPSIGWVQDLVYKDNRFLGILLIKIEGKKLTKLTLAKLSRRADKAWQRFSFKDPNATKLRLRTCFNLAVVIYQVHESGQYVLVDLKPDNVLMQPNGLLAVVDMDSVEVIENGKAIFAAPVATPEYTPPEHYIGPRGVINETWDRFSLGVIFYQLLLGLHPFAASSHPPYDNLVSIHDKIQQDLYVHNSAKEAFLKVIPPPHKRHDELPLEIQELFQACFVDGSGNPFSRPSALDWCITLASLLNLPFKGIPDYDLPLKMLPKIDLQIIDFHFKPNHLFVINSDYNLHYRPASIDPIDVDKIAPVENSAPSMMLPTMQKKLWDTMETTYTSYLQTHRKSLFTGIVTLIPFLALSVLFPWSLIFGSTLLFFAFSMLMFRTNKNLIHSVGEIISPSSSDHIPSKQDNLLASNNIQSTIQDLESKKETLNSNLNRLKRKVKSRATQHLKKVNSNKKYLSEIREKMSAQKVLADSILQFNAWTEHGLQLALTETRTKELKAYPDLYESFSKQFAVQLEEKKAAIKEAFRDFNNTKFNFEKSINLQKKKCLTVKDDRVKEQMLIDYEEALKTNNLDYVKKLADHKESIQNPLLTADHTLKKVVVFQKKIKIQLKYNKRKEQSALKKAKKKLGKNFLVNLKRHLDLLYKSGPTTELYFAHDSIRKLFKLLQEEISTLNLDTDFQDELSDLLTPEVASKWIITPPLHTSNLIELNVQQVGMLDEWLSIEKELQKLQEKIGQLQLGTHRISTEALKKTWLEELKNSILSIKTSEGAYHQFQTAFYNDSQIAKIHSELKDYRQAEQIKQDLEDSYSKQVLLSNKKDPFSKEQKEIDEELKIYQQKLTIEEEENAKKITLAYEQSLVDLEKKWDLDIQNIEQEINQETEELAQLKTDFQSFQDDIKTTVLDAEIAYPKELEKTRLKFEGIYKDYKTTYQERLETSTKEYDFLTKGRLDLISQIKTHLTQHIEDTKYLSSVHEKDLANLQAIENEIAAVEESIENTAGEKIKIETLIKWQENYSSRIYIKDLLLNKVEQFRENEDNSMDKNN
jgi:hypothetical protein